MENDKIHISEAIEISKKFLEGKLSQEELEIWGSKISIRLYLPMLEKYDIMAKILFKINFTEFDSTELKIIELEMQKFWLGLLRYTNIEVPYEEVDMYCNLINYDIVYPVIGEWIKQYCRIDFETLDKMIDSNLNLFNVINVATTLENISPQAIKQANEDLKCTVKALKKNEKLITSIGDVMIYNNPFTQKVVEEMKSKAIENTKNKKQ